MIDGPLSHDLEFTDLERAISAIQHAQNIGMDFSLRMVRYRDPAFENDILRRGVWTTYYVSIFYPTEAVEVAKPEHIRHA